MNVATALARAASGDVCSSTCTSAHGDAAVFLGAEPRFSVVDALENMHRLDEAFFSGLVVQTKVGRRPARLVRSRVTGCRRPAADSQRCSSSPTRKYRYTVLDVPRSDAAVLDALEIASSIVVVANQELATLRSAGRDGAGAAPALRQGRG